VCEKFAEKTKFYGAIRRKQNRARCAGVLVATRESENLSLVLVTVWHDGGVRE
jgi:hypothetical protein